MHCNKVVKARRRWCVFSCATCVCVGRINEILWGYVMSRSIQRLHAGGFWGASSLYCILIRDNIKCKIVFPSEYILELFMQINSIYINMLLLKICWPALVYFRDLSKVACIITCWTYTKKLKCFGTWCEAISKLLRPNLFSFCWLVSYPSFKNVNLHF